MTVVDVVTVARSCTGDGIRYKRQQLGLSARALSLRAGLSAAYVFKVERGSIEPSLRSFSRIATALGMTRAEIWLCVSSEARDADERFGCRGDELATVMDGGTGVHNPGSRQPNA